jgi:hypothetical protein
MLPWAAAAALAVIAGLLLIQNASLRAENRALRTERELAEVASRMALVQLKERSLLAEKMINGLGTKLRQAEDLARHKVSPLAPPAGNAREARAIAVWDPSRQTGLLTVEKLPPIGAEQDYQLWITDPADPNPVNGGVFHVAADGTVVFPFKPDRPVTDAAAFAISVEKKGGAPKVEGTPLLLGK